MEVAKTKKQEKKWDGKPQATQPQATAELSVSLKNNKACDGCRLANIDTAHTLQG